VKTIRRTEWRGDLFASDLGPFLDRLAAARVVSYRFSHTLTIFLRPPDSDFRVDGTLRLRAYRALPDLAPESVRRAITHGLSGKLQVKELRGATTELQAGPVMFLHANGDRDAWGRLQIGKRTLEPTSVRVARRVHYKLPQDAARVTVDLERSLFRVARNTLRPLGDMGPRIEIKAARSRDVQRALARLNPDGALRRLRYGSLELLFQDLLGDLVRHVSGKANPEIEAKFDMADVDLARAASAVIDWLHCNSDTLLLLPAPHQVVRMRRYHFCASDDADAQCTIVETAAGRLSAKLKLAGTVQRMALVRATEASRTTNRDGVRTSVDSFARQRGWRPFNSMTKIQSKIPFVLRNGHAYLVSIDHCVDARGRVLRQLELEAIGSLFGAAPQTNIVCTELEALARRVKSRFPELALRPTTDSKFAFYSRQQ
jgi:hypothetical protein